MAGERLMHDPFEQRSRRRSPRLGRRHDETGSRDGEKTETDSGDEEPAPAPARP